MSSLLKLEGIVKSFPSPMGGAIEILQGVNLTLEKGEVVAIVGRSGSGKSTLLSIAALLSSPDSGRIFYNERDVTALKEKEISVLRSHIGFVFQSSQLLSDFSALENTAMPLMIQGEKKERAFSEARKFLKLVGLEERETHRSAELSGGEKQRVAIARALAGNPHVVFADEPTGSLDEKNAELVEELLLSAVRSTSHSMLLVTHNMSFARKADRVFELREGRLSEI